MDMQEEIGDVFVDMAKDGADELNDELGDMMAEMEEEEAMAAMQDIPDANMGMIQPKIG